MIKIKETDLFLPVKLWLEKKNYEVYGEVQIFSYGRIIDVVGKRDDEIIAVELKTSFGLKLLEQAWENQKFVDYSYCAIPELSKHRSGFGRKVAIDNGLGILHIWKDWESEFRCKEYLKPSQKEHQGIMKDYLLNSLNPLQQDSIGGSTSGGHITPYKITLKLVKEFLSTMPEGATFREIAQNVITHYSNPVSGIRGMIDFEYSKGWCKVIGKRPQKVVMT